MPTITYTLTDEAPRLATASLLPILKTFSAPFGIDIRTADISLAARALAAFSDTIQTDTRDDLAVLTKYVTTPECCLIKLPNISASVAQLKACIAELQNQGFAVPNFPENPQTKKEQDILTRYKQVLGSAVNPKLRDGNSDRRIPVAVKDFARTHPHPMGAWASSSKTHVSSMSKGDFYASEKSFVSQKDQELGVYFQSSPEAAPELKAKLQVEKGAILDAAYMSKKELEHYFHKAKMTAAEEDVILSLHLKATMMKVSDPIIFGVALHTYFQDTFHKWNQQLKECQVSPRFGLKDLFSKIQGHPDEQAIRKDFQDALSSNKYKLAMVDSHKGISNLHVPSDIIIDASMASMIRNGGKMWAQDGNEYDTKALIPDRSYASIYQTTIDFHKQHGAFDPRTMGSVANVGLMAKKAEEYGSHNTTFQSTNDGTFSVRDVSSQEVYLTHQVEKGDIWRLCHTADIAIRDWVKLAVKRTELAQNSKSYFWLDNKRAHDRALIDKVQEYLPAYNRNHLSIKILSYKDATESTLERIKNGENAIAITGNVLRDYLTDLFPILEVSSSAKMLSQVSLLAGGGLFETGSGGSAPKHVQQFQKENHLRWDSLGEFLAFEEALSFLQQTSEHLKPLLKATSAATARYLSTGKYPSRKCHELDNRGSHFYFSLYLLDSLTTLSPAGDLKTIFAQAAQELAAAQETILTELLEIQGHAISTQDMGGYYHPSEEALKTLMRPSKTWNHLLETTAATLTALAQESS